jgi:glycosyltransferase involved in cell wall biosynthesis
MNTAKLHIVHTEASLGWGGQEIRILTEAAGMILRGHQVTLLCPPQARIFQEAGLRGVPVESLEIGRKNLKGLLAMYRWLKNHRVDVINTHSSTDTWLVALASALLPVAPPLVRTRHISAPVPDNLPTRWLYQSATRHVVTTGEKLRRQLIEQNRYDPASLTSVPTGIDTAHFVPGEREAARRSLGLAADGMVVGIVATLRSWKGHTYLLDAFAGLADRSTRLLIVGDGPQRDALQARVAELGLGERVVMPGNQRDVLPWLHAIDIFVLPSYANEGVPQALLQAMSCGLPVIGTPIGSITEAVEHQRTGLIVEPRQTNRLRNALELLLGDPVLRHNLGAAAVVDGRNRFGMEKMLDKMESIFMEAANYCA